MYIPADVQILATIKRGSVYYFEEENFTTEEPHFFVILNKNPRSEDFLILVCASSQVEKRKQWAIRRGFPMETLVIVTPTEFSLFTVETVIDCNSIIEKPTQSLIEKLQQGKLRVCSEEMPDYIIEKLIQGALVSNQVSVEVQEMLLGTDADPHNRTR